MPSLNHFAYERGSNHSFAEWDLQIPGVGESRFDDPCVHTRYTKTGFLLEDGMGEYFGTTLTPADVALDRGWQLCEHCDGYAEDPDCPVCHGTYVVVHADWSEDCQQCGGTGANCSVCLSTGWNFVPPDTATTPPAPSGENPLFEATTHKSLSLVAPEPETRPPFVLEVRVLHSAHRVPCNACQQGVQRTSNDGGVTWDLATCTRCHGAGDRPAVTGKWLCNVDTDTGEHWPKHLPVQRHPERGLVRARHYNRNWRESDGQNHPVRRSRLTHSPAEVQPNA